MTTQQRIANVDNAVTSRTNRQCPDPHQQTMSAQEALDALSFLHRTARRDAADSTADGMPPEETDEGLATLAAEISFRRDTTESDSQIPDWIEDYDAEKIMEQRTNDHCNLQRQQPNQRAACPQTMNKVATSTSPLEALAFDVSAHILSHLTLIELADVSLVSRRVHDACRSNALWKLLFDRSWNFRTTRVVGNWYYQAYQEAYHNPHDLWITHWNCVFPNDGLAPGRCCILAQQEQYDEEEPKDEGARHEVCPTCRFFPEHPLSRVEAIIKNRQQPQQTHIQRDEPTLAEAIADATDHCIVTFAEEHQHDLSSPLSSSFPSYSSRRARRAFENAATFHRKIDTRQYTAIPPCQIHDHQPPNESTTSCRHSTSKTNTNTLVFLKDLLFFNVTEEPYGTQQGIQDMEHLMYERQCQVDFEANEQRHSSAGGLATRTSSPAANWPRRQRRRRRQQRQNGTGVDHDNNNNNNNNHTIPRHPAGPAPQEWLKPAYETAHHSWHTALISNPDYDRPVVFRVSVQRPDCFVVFPSEGYLEPGQSVVVVFGVRPLGSLLATAMDRVNVEREGVDPELNRVFHGDALLPVAPFLIQYKYSSLVPCVPAHGGFVPPYRPQWWRRAHETDRSRGATQHVPSVADICWQQKELVEYHWSGLNVHDRPAVAVEAHEIRSIYLSAHVNAHYPLWQFCADTLTPFSVSVKPGPAAGSEEIFPTPMLYYNAPHLQEFYNEQRMRSVDPSSVPDSRVTTNKIQNVPTLFAQLQNVDLEEKVSHAGQVFRSQRQRCLKCRRPGWGARLEEIGHAYVCVQLECRDHYNKRNHIIHNCVIATRQIDQILKQLHKPSDESCRQKRRVQRILHTVYDILQRFRAAPYLRPRQRQVLACLEIAVDRLYGEACSVVGRIKTKGCANNDDNIQDFGSAESPTMEESTAPNSPEYKLLDRCVAGNNNENHDNDCNLSLSNPPDENYDGDNAAETFTPWRHAGIYRFRLSTDSVYGSDQTVMEYDFVIQKALSAIVIKEEPEILHAFRHLVHSPGRYRLGPQEDPNHLGELVPPPSSNGAREFFRQQRGLVSDIFMDSPMHSLRGALCMLQEPRSILVAYQRILYPGKVVRRPQLPLSMAATPTIGAAGDKSGVDNPSDALSDFHGHMVYFMLQDSGELGRFATQSKQQYYSNSNSNFDFSLSLRRYVLNIPQLGLGLRFPICIDKDGAATALSRRALRLSDTDLEATSSIVALEIPRPWASDGADPASTTANDSTASTADLSDEAGHIGGGNARNVNNNMVLAVPGGHLFRGPRLLNLAWSLAAQLGWTVDDVGRNGASVVVDRKMIIALQWVSISLMVGPLFWTLLARSVRWIPCKPVSYHLQDLPYETRNEMRFLNEHECGQVAVLLITVWLVLGRRTERMTSRDFFRAMLEHVSVSNPVAEHGSYVKSFMMRLGQRYQRQWDAFCPQFLQRLIFTPHWNLRDQDDLLKHVACWRGQERRELRSVFRATSGQGLMFCGRRWNELVVREESSSRKMLIAAVVALGSFSSSTPHFWINLVTVFICSIGLGLSVSLHTLETGVAGAAARQTGSLLKSLHLVTLVILAFLVGQMLGSSGGMIFLAEFVVTSISFLLGGAGTISASSVESWGVFFLLSMASFWGYLFGRVSVVDGILRHRRQPGISGLSSLVLSASLLLAFLLWLLLFVWRWDVPVSLIILRHTAVKAARGGGATSAGVGAARSSAVEYASKHLQ